MNNININDRVESGSDFENFIERYLHLNCCGRKFKLFKGTVDVKDTVKEQIDLISTKKILGNIARVVSYIFLFPIPLACLAIRTWQRSNREIEVITLDENSFNDDKYINLFEVVKKPSLTDSIEDEFAALGTENEEEVKQPILQVSKEELIGKVQSGLKNKKMTKATLGDFFEKYNELATEVMKKHLEYLHQEYYYHHQLTVLDFLKSEENDGLFPDSTRLKFAEEIQSFLLDKINKAADASEKDKNKFFDNILFSTKNYSQEIFNLSPQFWIDNETMLKKLKGLDGVQPMLNLIAVNKKK